MTNESIHRGVLHVQRSKALRQKWKRCFCAIYGTTSLGVARIEIYESEENFAQAKDAYNIILRDAISVKKVPGDSRFATVLQLATNSQTYLFATENDYNDLEAWIQLISEVAFSNGDFSNSAGLPAAQGDEGPDINDEACYEAPWDIQDVPVTIIETNTSSHYGLYGDYDMTLSPDGIILKVNSSVAKIWAYSEIDRFGVGNDCFAMQTKHGEIFEFTSSHPFRLLEKIRSFVPLNLDIDSPENSRMPVILNYTDYFRALRPSYREPSIPHSSGPPDVPRFDTWAEPFDRTANERRSYPKMGTRHRQDGNRDSPLADARVTMLRSASQSDDPYGPARAAGANQQFDRRGNEYYDRDYGYGSRNTLREPMYPDQWGDHDSKQSKKPKQKSHGTGFLEVLRRISTRRRKSSGRSEQDRSGGSARNSGLFVRRRPSMERQFQRDKIYPDYYPPNHGYYPPSDFSYDGSLPANYGRDSVYLNEDVNLDKASLQMDRDYRSNYGGQRSDMARRSPAPERRRGDQLRNRNGGTVYYYPGSDTKYASDPRAADMTERPPGVNTNERLTRSGGARSPANPQYIPSHYELTQQFEQVKPSRESAQREMPDSRVNTVPVKPKPQMYAEDEDYDEIDDEAGDLMKQITDDLRDRMSIDVTPVAKTSNHRQPGRPAAYSPPQSRSAPASATSRVSRDPTGHYNDRSIRRKESNQSLGGVSRQSNASLAYNDRNAPSNRKLNAPAPPQRRLSAAARDRRNNRSTDV